ncbi:FMN-dependent NADH-azoreductase [Cohnella nanjingensis]|uniref:FMN dependent NADH:quinone oxidoreductase n=1 Tax=Cohnella nanjingensis TaxID=1387779 RepID=A0A7X0VHD0_9BACL|nr:FMN-dependent NADH-azoreductase [Cohnella nanjingensis]MBB6673358.1 FMN-dependent NADH-azoreductase [Cohnella nanjingensis]
MAKVLYISANPGNEKTSFSLAVGRRFLDAYKAINPEDEVVELDLYKMSIPLIDSDIVSGWEALQSGVPFPSLNDASRQKIAALNELTAQFVGADKYIFVSPMWNLSLPPMMKAYIDTAVVAGKTYQYTPEGPVGLLGGKKGIHINARGRVYDGDLARLEFGDSYLRTIMRFIGVEMLDSVVVQGTALAPDQAEEIKRQAFRLSEDAAKRLASA